MRVNARLDEDSSQKLSYLERETGWGVSEIIRKAIQTYYRDFRREKVEPKTALERSGFIACADGPRDLSVTYKTELRGLDSKHGHR